MGVWKQDAWGWPDWTFWHPRKGRFIVRELKGARGTLTSDQKRVLAELRECGVDAKAWWPRDSAEIIETFAA